MMSRKGTQGKSTTLSRRNKQCESNKMARQTCQRTIAPGFLSFASTLGCLFLFLDDFCKHFFSFQLKSFLCSRTKHHFPFQLCSKEAVWTQRPSEQTMVTPKRCLPFSTPVRAFSFIARMRSGVPRFQLSCMWWSTNKLHRLFFTSYSRPLGLLISTGGKNDSLPELEPATSTSIIATQDQSMLRYGRYPQYFLIPGFHHY